MANQNPILVTGAAGFIGAHLAAKLTESGYDVVGIDNLNSYYEVSLKHARLETLLSRPGFRFVEMDLVDEEMLSRIFREFRPALVVHLAAQAGVRYSLENPQAYIQSNLVGFGNVLEASRRFTVDRLLYASSSSVYGLNSKVPFSESDRVDHPVSLYAATKRSNELIAEAYSHLYSMNLTGLRFFTVYGPLGRPDMAYFSFTRKFFANEPIAVFNGGDVANDLSRDFTYVDDVIESIFRLVHHHNPKEPSHQILNVGGSRPYRLTEFIATLEQALSSSLGRPVEFQKLTYPRQPGDVTTTFADAARLKSTIGYQPTTPLLAGLTKFTDWFVSYYS